MKLRGWVSYSVGQQAAIEEAPCYVVYADVKRHVRLNCISHLLSMIE